jgi:hypothetical protein
MKINTTPPAPRTSSIPQHATTSSVRRDNGEIDKMKRETSSLNTRAKSLVMDVAKREGENASSRELV